MNGVITQEMIQDVVSLEELKLHLRVDGELEDAYLTSLIRAAIDFAENYTRRSIVKRQVNIFLDGFSDSVIRLGTCPVQEIVQVSYENVNGEATVLPIESYRAVLDVDPPLVMPISSWPGDVLPIPGSVRVEAVVGYEQVPMSIHQAILLLCGHFYENREVMRTQYVTANEMPFSVSALLYPYKVLRW